MSCRVLNHSKKELPDAHERGEPWSRSSNRNAGSVHGKCWLSLEEVFSRSLSLLFSELSCFQLLGYVIIPNIYAERPACKNITHVCLGWEKSRTSENCFLPSAMLVDSCTDDYLRCIEARGRLNCPCVSQRRRASTSGC